MSQEFSKDFEKFQVKIHKFVLETNFASKASEYKESFNKMASVAPDDMKHYIQQSPDFLQARNESLSLMEKIVELHMQLEDIFKMDESALYIKSKGDLASIDKEIALHVKESARLIHQFEKVSEIGRKAIEKVDNPFFAQASS